MHYVTTKRGRLGAVIQGCLIDIDAASSALGLAVLCPDIWSLLDSPKNVQDEFEKLANMAYVENVACVTYMPELVGSPLPQLRRNVFCIGKNYADHALEIADKMGISADLPKYPIVFSKATNTLIGPLDTIPLHEGVTGKIDYEGELALVIGKAGINISKQDAWSHIFGFSCYNDVSARDLQKRHNQWHLGKCLDGFGPMGPAITPTYGKPLSEDTRLTCKVNGELRQDATLAQMIFDIPTLIATLSAGITLEVGDVIATGTPAGVGMGFNPMRFLAPGDEVEVAIDGTLPLTNRLALA
jgi:2-keto-4-pentenoate hydratase/2-oxohepta-3-ene-1,7-dioic acid hydratase in catechol pathway|tara:strand:- start:2121 stop:3017 length:897 start_codon:yes stop_codon:yes gene_type:complete